MAIGESHHAAASALAADPERPVISRVTSG
jgi:hypothetical protein